MAIDPATESRFPTPMKNAALTIVVEVLLDSKIVQGELKEGLPALEKKAVREIKRMVEGLDIPSTIKLSFSICDDPDHWIRLMINDTVCRLPFFLNIPEDVHPEWLGDLIVHGILQNRKYLITLQHAQVIRERWSAKRGQRYLSNLSGTEFFEYLRLLLEYGFRIDRGDHLNPFEYPLHAPLAFEKAVVEVKNIQLIFHVPRESSDKKEDKVLVLKNIIARLQENLYYELGLRIPLPTFPEDEGLAANEYRLQINDVSLPVFRGLDEDEFLVNARKEDLSQKNIEGKPSGYPVSNDSWHIFKDTGALHEQLRAAGFETFDPGASIELYLRATLLEHAGCWLTSELIEFELANLYQRYPDLVQSFRIKFRDDFLIRLLRELLREKISIRDLKGIIESLLGAKTVLNAEFSEKIILIPSQYMPLFAAEEKPSPKLLEPASFVETVRVSQKLHITNKFTRGKGNMEVFLLHPSLEKLFREPISMEKKHEILAAIAKELEHHQSIGRYTIILTSIELRKRLKEFIEFEFAFVHVLSYLELTTDTNIQAVGRIELPEGGDG